MADERPAGIVRPRVYVHIAYGYAQVRLEIGVQTFDVGYALKTGVDGVAEAEWLATMLRKALANAGVDAS